MRAVAPMVEDKHGDHFLREHAAHTEHVRQRLGHYVTKGPAIKPIRPEYIAAVLSELADDDAVFTVDTGTPCIWAARHIEYGRDRRMFGSFTWASMGSASPKRLRRRAVLPQAAGHRPVRRRRLHHARARRPADPGPAQARVVNVIFNNGMLDFVNLEQQEAGIIPFGTDFVNPDFSQVAKALGGRGVRVEEPGDVRDALRAALAHTDGPVVVDAVVDR